MDRPTLRIALAQIHCLVGVDDNTLEGNIDSLRKALLKAKEQNCDIAVAPELAVCGYSPEDLLNRSDVCNKVMKFTDSFCNEILQNNNSISFIFGAPRVVARGHNSYPQGLYSLTTLDLGNTALANAIICINTEKKRISEIYKKHLPNWGVFDEARLFAGASEIAEPVEINGIRVGILNCRDAWHESSIKDLIEKRAQCIVVPNASPFAHSRHGERIRVMSGYAKKYSIPIIYVNTCHGCDELVFDGGSFVVDMNGELIHESPRWKENFSVVEVEIPEICSMNSSITLGEDPSGGLLEYKFDSRDAYNAILLGLRDFVNAHSKDSHVLIGISGGIDSALVATLAVDAFGSNRVHGVMLPSRFTSGQSIDDAQELCKRLSIELQTIPIEQLFNSAMNSIQNELAPSIVSENIQSRIRGVILMAQSNLTGQLVINTGNKSEGAVGYSTLYGDTIGAYSPIKDVYKTHVYELSNWRNESEEYSTLSPIPQEIIDRTPSAELRENQKDEDTLLSYPILDGILERFIDYEMSIDEIVQSGYCKEDVSRIVCLVKSSEFKRKQSPIGPRLTRRNFGKSRRIPICASW